MADAALTAPELDARLEALHDASFGWACNCCFGDADEAADVLQTCYVKVLSGRAVFGGRSGFRTWWFGVIRFTALEARRRGARELAMAGQQVPGDAPPTPEALLLEDELGQTLKRALVRLPERQRDVLHLVFYQGMTVAEAAGVMQLSVGSVRVHYDRGKKRLREWLAPSLGTDSAEHEREE